MVTVQLGEQIFGRPGAVANVERGAESSPDVVSAELRRYPQEPMNAQNDEAGIATLDEIRHDEIGGGIALRGLCLVAVVQRGLVPMVTVGDIDRQAAPGVLDLLQNRGHRARPEGVADRAVDLGGRILVLSRLPEPR